MNYVRQTNKPLFDDIFWSRPERASTAGKLIIIGGNRDSLKAPLAAYQSAVDAGAGSIDVFVPDTLKKTLGAMPGVTFVASTSSGSLAKEAIQQIEALAAGADHMLLPGDCGRSSETTQALEELIVRSPKRITLAGEVVDVLAPRAALTDKERLTLVLNGGQLQKIAKQLSSPTAYTSSMPLDAFAAFITSLGSKAAVVTLHSEHLWVVVNGEVSATHRPDLANEQLWQATIASRVSVFNMQHPDEQFKALSSACFNQSELTTNA